jgi:hypothetical protein
MLVMIRIGRLNGFDSLAPAEANDLSACYAQAGRIACHAGVQ